MGWAPKTDEVIEASGGSYGRVAFVRNDRVQVEDPTADTIAALKHARGLGMPHTLTICNVATSAMVRETAMQFITRAGVEIGVASTKAFTTQLVALFLLTMVLAKRRGKLPAGFESWVMFSPTYFKVAFGAWVILALIDRDYRPRYSWVSASVVLFVSWMLIANRFGASAPGKAVVRERGFTADSVVGGATVSLSVDSRSAGPGRVTRGAMTFGPVATGDEPAAGPGPPPWSGANPRGGPGGPRSGCSPSRSPSEP